MDTKKMFKRTLLVIITIPILVNISLAFSTPITFGDDWQGFFGDYLGAIVGGITAFFIAYYQIEKQRQSDEENDLQANRSYINAEEFIAPIDLIDTKHKEFSKIMETDYYKDYKKKFNQDSYRYEHIPYYRINHSGLPEAILNCKLIFKLSEPEGDTAIPYEIVTHIGVFEKSIDIFIPLIKSKNEVIISKFELEYTTLKNEKIIYIKDIENKKESHWLIKDNGDRDILFEFDIKASNWIYPNSKIEPL